MIFRIFLNFSFPSILFGETEPWSTDFFVDKIYFEGKFSSSKTFKKFFEKKNCILKQRIFLITEKQSKVLTASKI